MSLALSITELLFCDTDSTGDAETEFHLAARERQRDDVGDFSSTRVRPDHSAVNIDAIRRGDVETFEQLFREYFPRLTHHARILVGSTDVAEELAQDVLWSVWERRATWTVHGTVATYLHSAVHHRAQQYLRNDRNRARILAGALTDDVPLMTPTRSVTQSMEHDELVAEVRRAIDSLPAGRRLTLTLRWDEGLSYAEIAEVVGSSVKAVENQLNRTLHQLRELLRHVTRER